MKKAGIFSRLRYGSQNSLFPVRYLHQPILIRHCHPAAVELYDALTGEVFEQAAHHLTGRAHVLCHLILRQADVLAAGLGKLCLLYTSPSPRDS